jgi:Mannosyl-glycoprotein endo-beta-N-acetylglucosaminidase
MMGKSVVKMVFTNRNFLRQKIYQARWYLLSLPNWAYGLPVMLLAFFLLYIAGQPPKVEFYAFEKTASPPLNKSGVAQSSGVSVVAKPSISPTKIDAVLRQYNSPALGIGQVMYDLGLKYGIDPAFALAFFVHESSAGTKGVAVETKSIGNIRCTAGYECYRTQGNGAFRKYASWEVGTEDWFKLIKDLYIGKWGLTTVEQILPVYAPVGDKNNPSAYAQHVTKLVASWKGEL